jgi:ribosomal protein S18 acetylase RimI-like enzyme
MNEAIQIRSFQQPDDYGAVLDLWDRSGPGVHVGRSDTFDEIRKKLNRDPDLFLITESGGEIIGAVLGGYDGRRALVYHLAVSKDHRQQGNGKALMETLEDRLQEKGCLRSY